jgi:hypothetical protein
LNVSAAAISSFDDEFSRFIESPSSERSSWREIKGDFSAAKLERFAPQLSLVINDYRGGGIRELKSATKRFRRFDPRNNYRSCSRGDSAIGRFARASSRVSLNVHSSPDVWSRDK